MFKKVFSVILILILYVSIVSAVSSIHTTDTDFQQATLENMAIVGSGESATVELSKTNVTYNPLNEGDGIAEDSGELLGDGPFNSKYKVEIRIKPNNTGKIIILNPNIDHTVGGDYGANIDIYIVKGNPNLAYGEGTLVKDNWNPNWEIGKQTIILDTEYKVDKNTNYTIEFFTQNSDFDGVSDAIFIKADKNQGWSTGYTIATGLGGFPREWAIDLPIKINSLNFPASYINTHSLSNTDQGTVNISSTNNVSITVTYKGDSNGDGSYDTLLNQTTGITQSGNHTFTWDKFSGSDIQINVTVESTGSNETFVLESEKVSSFETVSTDTPTDTPTKTQTETKDLGFNELINPDRITQPLIYLIILFLIIVPFIGIKLRNAIIFIFWGFTVITLLFVFLLSLEFIWFWVMAILTTLSIAFVSILKEVM